MAEQGLRTQELYCEVPGGAVINVADVPFGKSDKVYRADLKREVILFYVEEAYQRPEAVAKLDFASACLEFIGVHDDVCASVKYLRSHGAFNTQDLSVLEDYYFSRDTADPQALPTLKRIYSCY